MNSRFFSLSITSAYLFALIYLCSSLRLATVTRSLDIYIGRRSHYAIRASTGKRVQLKTFAITLAMISECGRDAVRRNW